MEFRLTYGCSHVYLVLISTIVSMLDGVEQNLTLPAPIDEDIYEWDEAELVKLGVKSLPQTLGEALATLSADSTLAKALGDDFVAEYLATKTPEWIEYCRSVSDWEFKRYLTWP